MKTVMVVLVCVVLLAPASWAGGRGWKELEERLGLVEQEVNPLKIRLDALEEKVDIQQFKILRLQSRLNCHLKPKTCTIASRRP